MMHFGAHSGKNSQFLKPLFLLFLA